MNRWLTALFCFISITTLSGCSHLKFSWFSAKQDTAYLSARSIPPLKVPPGLKNDSFSAYYPVSTGRYAPPPAPLDITPPGIKQ